MRFWIAGNGGGAIARHIQIGIHQHRVLWLETEIAVE
jgi:hypothetical protein